MTDSWDRHATWWRDNFTEGADPEYEEQLIPLVLANLPEGGRLINGYGPTENTTFTCCHVMTRESRVETTVPIGRPIANTTVYILDDELQPAPIGGSSAEAVKLSSMSQIGSCPGTWSARAT